MGTTNTPSRLFSSSPATSQVSSRMLGGLLTVRPTLYIIVLLAGFGVGYLYQLRANNIFACQAGGYTSDRFLSYCGATGYGDYEHGAFWFDLEPSAQASAKNAEVLFIGDSRLQFAFSTPAIAQWFSSASASYYLLGFIEFENSVFFRALLPRLKPKAVVYIINIPEFFQASGSLAAKGVMDGGEAARLRYRMKRLLQSAHKAICGPLPKLCGHAITIYESRPTGVWYMAPSGSFEGSERPVSSDNEIHPREVREAIELGQTFISELPTKPECIILTAVPGVGLKLGDANAIANGLGKRLVAPEQLDDLKSFDGVHLAFASAERWSEAFFKIAGPQIRNCLETQAADR